jgi:hypothetical protein
MLAKRNVSGVSVKSIPKLDLNHCRFSNRVIKEIGVPQI